MAGQSFNNAIVLVVCLMGCFVVSAVVFVWLFATIKAISTNAQNAMRIAENKAVIGVITGTAALLGTVLTVVLKLSAK